MRILITGISGFVGSHLAEYSLTKKGIRVLGTILPRRLIRDELKRVEHIKSKIELIECDLTNRIATERVLEIIKPDKIFHLAGLSSISVSWKLPEDILFTNLMAELNIFEAVRKLNINPIIQIACSSEEYGLVNKKELPIKETNLLRPLSPYAVSKVAQEMLAFQYNRSYGLKTVITRAFNHEGPRRGKDFVTSAFASQIVKIEKGLQEPLIKVGNLEAVRDFTDVRDMVRAYWLATEKCRFGEPYNIGSGKGYKIKEVLNILLSFSKKKIKVVKDENLMRPSESPVLICDATKFKKETGWEAKIDFKATLKDVLNYWRGAL